MSKILQALERNNSGLVNPDNVIASFTDSLVRQTAATELAEREVKSLASQLAVVNGRCDRLQAEAQRFAAVNTELGQLREKCQALEASAKQHNAAILLEQGTLQSVSTAADEARSSSTLLADTLRRELATEKERSAKLTGELTAVKNRPVTPAPVQQIMPPAPVDYSGMEFSIGSVVRGPDGIQGASIKLVKSN